MQLVPIGTCNLTQHKFNTVNKNRQKYILCKFVLIMTITFTVVPFDNVIYEALNILLLIMIMEAHLFSYL